MLVADDVGYENVWNARFNQKNEQKSVNAGNRWSWLWKRQATKSFFKKTSSILWHFHPSSRIIINTHPRAPRKRPCPHTWCSCLRVRASSGAASGRRRWRESGGSCCARGWASLSCASPRSHPRWWLLFGSPAPRASSDCRKLKAPSAESRLNGFRRDWVASAS